VIELSKEDKYIVLATDGLWDEISRKSSAKIATELASKPLTDKRFTEVLIRALCAEALEHAAKTSGISMEYLRMLQPGEQKRQIVDDITVIVVDLTGQAV